MSTKRYDIAVVTGHFQVQELHPELENLLSGLAKKHKKLLVFINVSPALTTRRNPLDFATRKEMILKKFPEFLIFPLPEMPDEHSRSEELDQRISTVFPDEEAVIYELKNGSAQDYSGKFDCIQTDQFSDFQEKEISIITKSSRKFRTGIIYATKNQYPKVYPTVDVAIMDGQKILLGRKPHQDLFRFIGGFVDPTDLRYEQAAIREAFEETGVEIADLEYAGSAQIDDWRYRNEDDKIITTLFKAKYISGNPVAQDDIAELKWFDLTQLKEENFVKEHRILFQLLITNFKAAAGL